MNIENEKIIKEFGAIHRLINNVYPTGIVSIVSDSFDYWGVITLILPKLKNNIMSRYGKVVIRPDSGDPVRIIAGYTEDEIERTNDTIYDMTQLSPKGTLGKELTESEVKGTIQCMWDIFGGTFTDKKFKVLDSHIGAIYGDSITYQRAQEILERLKDKGFASSNIVFGIGSYTYQMTTRDSHGMAMKATYIEVDGKGREIFKNPKTDDGVKKSAKGLLMIIRTGKEFTLVDQVSKKEEARGALEPIFLNGKCVRKQSLDEIREIVKSFD